ncbi:pirin family protein [bacterium]|nr:pirin family protein [bacterium]
MIKLRRSGDRGRFDHGWLQTWHTFSFGSYVDPEHMGFRDLRVINQDVIQPGQGFGTHPHRDMEILTYVTDGALEHRDSMGNGSVIRPGEVQVMSAGRGVTHSEFNPDPDRPAGLLQIWVLPAVKGVEPRYDQRAFAALAEPGALVQLASPDGAGGSLVWGQDVRLWGGRLAGGQSWSVPVDPARHAWVQVVAGAIRLDDLVLEAGDGAAVSGLPGLGFEAQREAEILFFDLK